MQKTIIAISRQCGSGGHTIGKALAEKLGVPFYDKAYMDRMAGDVENKDLSATNLLFTLSESTGMYDGYLLSKPENAAESRGEADIICQLADVVGAPFDGIPVKMFTNGGAGYGQSSLCGCIGGAAACIGLVCAPADSSASVRASLKPWVASSREGCTISWQIATL